MNVIKSIAWQTLGEIFKTMRRWYFRLLNRSWPLRIKVLNEVSAAFLYPQRRCHVVVVAEFYTRTSPVILKNIYLEIKGYDHKETALSFFMRKDYEQLWFTTKREEEFIYDDFVDNSQGRLFVKADDDECRTKWFPIKLENVKPPPLDTIKAREIII